MLEMFDNTPSIQGSWTNPKTGHTFTVKDCYFEDGNFIVLTTTGQRIDFNMLQDYIQGGANEDGTPNNDPIGTLPSYDLPPLEVLAEIGEDPGYTPTPATTTPSNSILDKLFDKYNFSKITLSLDIKNNKKTPHKAIEIALEELDIKPTEIVNYFKEKLLQSKELDKYVTNYLKKELLK